MNGLHVAWADASARRALAAAALGGGALVIGGLSDAQRFFAAYLIAWLFVLAIGLGAMTMRMIHVLTGGAWGDAIAAPLRAAIGTIPLVAVLFVPLLFGLQHLYPWARPDAVAASPLLQEKAWYLNRVAFAVRSIAFLLIWSAMAWRIGVLEHPQRQSGPPRAGNLYHLSIAGLIVYTLTITLAAVDWIMSLTPEWYSTTFGLLTGVAQALAGFAFVVAWVALRSTRGRAAQAVGPATLNDLGNIALTLVLTWAYLAFTQYLIIWAEDLPHETIWYLPRVQSSWRLLGLGLIVFHFALPFLVLLLRSAKRSAIVMAALGVGLLLAHWLDVVWLVSPAIAPHGLTLDWTPLAATVALGGLCLAWIFGRSPQAMRDRGWKEAGRHG